MKFLQGYKTYILGVGAIITAIGAHLNGSIDTATMVQSIWAAIMAMTIRNGVTTDVSKATGKTI